MYEVNTVSPFNLSDKERQYCQYSKNPQNIRADFRPQPRGSNHFQYRAHFPDFIGIDNKLIIL